MDFTRRTKRLARGLANYANPRHRQQHQRTEGTRERPNHYNRGKADFENFQASVEDKKGSFVREQCPECAVPASTNVMLKSEILVGNYNLHVIPNRVSKLFLGHYSGAIEAGRLIWKPVPVGFIEAVQAMTPIHHRRPQ